MIIGAIATMVGIVILAYILGRTESRAECEDLTERGDKYRERYLNTRARLERVEFENDMLRAQLKEVTGPSLSDSVRQIEVIDR